MSAETGRWLAPLGSAVAVGTLVIGVSVLSGLQGARPAADHPPRHTTATLDFSGNAGRAQAGRRAGGDTAAVPLDSYTAHGRRLVLRYTITLHDCSGRVAAPRVTETPEVVLVTLHRVAPHREPGQACRNISLQDSLEVTLRAPLDGRSVLDGGRDGMPVPARIR